MPSGARFCFNCYRHHAILVIRGRSGNAAFIPSQEGVTQGDPLAMFCYGIGLLPLILQLKAEFPTANKEWYADDGANATHFKTIRAYFLRLQELGPPFGYYADEKEKQIVDVAVPREFPVADVSEECSSCRQQCRIKNVRRPGAPRRQHNGTGLAFWCEQQAVHHAAMEAINSYPNGDDGAIPMGLASNSARKILDK